MYINHITVEPLNKGHIGDNMCCPLQRGCPLLRGCKCIKTIGRLNIGDLKQCPLQRGLLYTVPISEGPLSEVLLYMECYKTRHGAQQQLTTIIIAQNSKVASVTSEQRTCTISKGMLLHSATKVTRRCKKILYAKFRP